MRVFVSNNMNEINLNPFSNPGVRRDGLVTRYLDEAQTALDFVRHEFSAAEKMAMFAFTYQDILQAKKEYEEYASKVLLKLINTPLYSREEGTRLKFSSVLDYSALPYKSTISFIRMLKNGNVPYEHIEELISLICENCNWDD